MLPVLAVDCGASSMRVARVDVDTSPPTIDVVHRHAHAPVEGRWDWTRIVAEIERGLSLAVERGPVASIGVDTWGVDYGLLGRDGALLSPPFSYRHPRTSGWREVVERIGAERLYAVTGIQLLALNTIFQLAAHDRDELQRASHLLLLPELVVHALTGAITGERTSAGTTALVDIETGDWSDELVDAIGVDGALLPPISPTGTPVGEWRGVPVHLVAGHDTASAVVALPGPPAPGAVFVSSGTWLLVGREQPRPDTSASARAANFSNEPAAFGGVRLLKNVTGLWLLQWAGDRLESLVDEAGGIESGPVINVNGERFVDPPDMEREIRTAAGLPDASAAVVVRCVLDSLAAAVAEVVAELGGAPELAVIGGGVRNHLLVDLIGKACGVPVRTGAAEATALGNALVQGIALGRFTDLDDARKALS